MSFTPQFLDEIRARVPLADTIGRRVRLVRRGREHVGLCPFHKEKTPSFTVNEDKGFFHCFGCGAHGDVIGFEMRVDNLGFPEAVERLAAAAGLSLPARTPEDRAQAKERASLYEVIEAACAWFEGELAGAGGRAAREYLADRSVAPATAAGFRLGWAPDSRGALKRALLGQGISEATLVTAGLLVGPEGGGAPYDRFRGRIVFPIADRGGRIVGFGGRALGEATPKYLNSPETPLFHKGSLLYGLAQARGPARDRREIVVAEGYMDVIALHRAGFENAAAPLGTALSEIQFRELWRLAPEPILCLDGDEAGQRAAFRAAERVLPLLRPGYSLRFAMLPKGEDPDSYIVSGGPGAFRDVLGAARHLSDVLWNSVLQVQTPDTPERRAALRRRLSVLRDRIEDGTVRDYYWQEFEARLERLFGSRRAGAGARKDPNVRYGREARFRRQLPALGPKLGTEHRRGVGPQSSPIFRERKLLSILLRFPQFIPEFRDMPSRVEIQTKEYRDVLGALLCGAEQFENQGKALEDVTFSDFSLGEDLGSAAQKIIDEESRLVKRYKNDIQKNREYSLRELEDILAYYHVQNLEKEVSEFEQLYSVSQTEENFRRFVAVKDALEKARSGRSKASDDFEFTEHAAP